MSDDELEIPELTELSHEELARALEIAARHSNIVRHAAGCGPSPTRATS